MKARIRDTEIYFDVDGAALVIDGSGARERSTAFLVHGGPGTDHTGLKVRYGKLTEKMQLVYFDHRGQGRSARGDPQSYTLDENVEDMEALRRYLGLGPVVSIGTSFGGMVAMAHAARYPEAVSHLVLVVTAAHCGLIARGREILAERGTAPQVALFEDVLAGRIDTPDKMRRYFESMGSMFSYRKASEGAPQALNLANAILSPEAQNRAYGPGGYLRAFDLRSELNSITAPTLIIAGRHDWICAPEFSEELHRLIRGSDLRIFENSSHLVTADEPEAFLGAVNEFLFYSRQEQGR
jgi:proline iminopeptidase